MKQGFLIWMILLLAFITIGCSSTPKRWYKSGATAKTFERDKSACEDNLLESSPSGLDNQLYTVESCMQAKGWTILDGPAM